MKYLILSLALVACGGGDPFTAAEFSDAGAGGDAAVAGTVTTAGDSSAAGTVGSSHAGGSASAGKSSGGSSSSAGKPSTGGTSAAGGAGGAGGAAGGATSVSCDFDPAALTAALPTSLVWQDYTYTNGDLCETCRDKPCATVSVISWGVPQVQKDGSLLYLPNTNEPMAAINYGANDGSCTKSVECGVKGGVGSAQISVARSANGWRVSAVKAEASWGGSACNERIDMNTGPMGVDFSSEIEKQLISIEMPCVQQ